LARDSNSAASREAAAMTITKEESFGVGSLAWLLREHKITDTAEMLTFISLPQHSELLDKFYEMLTPELAEKIKEALTNLKR
jgi:hypothetical protein